MVSSGTSREKVLDPHTEVAFPESVVQLFRGDLGQPYGGFPPALQNKILKGAGRRAPSALAPRCRRRTLPPSARASSSTCCGR